jgi:DNA polymerase III delta prime subunit
VILDRLSHIAQNERVETKPGTLDRLFKISQGDMRQCITLFQSVVRLRGGHSCIEPENVDEISGVSELTFITTGFEKKFYYIFFKATYWNVGKFRKCAEYSKKLLES